MLELVLSKQPEYLNQTKDGGFTPIMQAVTYRDRTTVRALVDRGCDVNAETSLGNYKKTALTFVTETKMQHEPDDIVEILLEAKADLHHCNGHGMQPLHYAVRNNCPLTTEKFIRYGADVNNTTELLGTPLHWAALYGSLEAARVLLENGA
ncbi:ankyrin, partial [Thozetella sp. PMI_491]